MVFYGILLYRYPYYILHFFILRLSCFKSLGQNRRVTNSDLGNPDSDLGNPDSDLGNPDVPVPASRPREPWVMGNPLLRVENLTKNENGNQNDIARHRKITYRTVRNRTKMRSGKKIRDKVARKKCTKPYVGIRRMFIRFLAIFPVLAGEHAAKHALSLDLTFQCLPNSARITLRFSAGRNTASPWNDFCAPKDSDTAANLTSVILWFVEAKAAKECNPNLVPVNLKKCCY